MKRARKHFIFPLLDSLLTQESLHCIAFFHLGTSKK